MAEFGASEQSLLRSLREGDEPSEADRARVARRLENELSIALGAGGVLLTVSTTTLSGGGAGGTALAGLSGQTLGTAAALGTGAAAGSGGAVAAGGALWATPLAKWGALALLGWGAGWGANELVRDRAPAGVVVTVPADAGAASRGTPEPLEAQRAAESVTPEKAPVPSSADDSATAPPVAGARPPAVARAAAPAAAAPSKVTLSGDRLEAELLLIGEAQRALSEQAPARALAALAEHARQFPRGTLRVERAGLNSIALCQAGQLTRGRESAERFVAQNPGSPLLGRVQRACGSRE